MSKPIKPIKPSEVTDAKIYGVFPPEVFDAFNELIAENFVDGAATVFQSEAAERIAAKFNPPDEETHGEILGRVYNRGWLNVEDAYREVGWQVQYDKPEYNESYSPRFIFRK